MNKYDKLTDAISELDADLLEEHLKMRADINKISESAFYLCLSLREINIPETVTSIEKEAFYGCAKLENIHFPENLETIEETKIVEQENNE